MSIDGRPSRLGTVNDPGPYEAVIVSHLDPKYMGTLQVELLKSTSGGNQPERSGQIITARYLNPFYGTTPISATSKNDTFEATQKSYGMWFVPPDVGTRVLVIFIEGNISRAVWIGCIQDSFMNFMVPDPWAGSVHNQQDQTKPLPVGEFNKRNNFTNLGNNPTTYPKPVNTDALNILSTQGLLDDGTRGLSTSTARRELPSKVFGISTPGPVDKRENAPKTKVGAADTKAFAFSSRLGGSSLVFDDGNDLLLRKGHAGFNHYEFADQIQQESGGSADLPFNECVRLRTRTGHQILLHNTEDLIYIGNAQGSTWIELTSNGKIDIFANDSISIRSAMDVNITADRDMNFSAMRDVNFNAGRDFKLTVGRDSDIKIGFDHKIDIGAEHHVFVGSNQRTFVGENNHLIVELDNKITVKKNMEILVVENRKDQQRNLDNYTQEARKDRQTSLDILTVESRKDKQKTFDLDTEKDNKLTAGSNTHIKSGGNHRETASRIDMNGPGASSAASAEEAQTSTRAELSAVAQAALWPTRIPEHEPWHGHEHLDPLTFVPNFTRASANAGPAIRNSSPSISKEDDERPSSTEYKRSANVQGPQEVVYGTAEQLTKQPDMPVSAVELQRYFLHELIKSLGLPAGTCLNSADPSRNEPGATPGNAEALAMALAQVQAECGFVPRSENLNYSARRLRQVFPNRVRSDSFARELSMAGPVAIGNTLYGGRLGNARDEGFKYRGRGLIQITFKSNYQRYGNLAGTPQIVDNPDLANDPAVSTKVAVAYLKSKSINWSSHDITSLGQQFKQAVGYADQGGRETSRRVELCKGLRNKLIKREITPQASLTTVPAGTNIEAGKRSE